MTISEDIEEIVFSLYAISSSTEIRFNCSQGEDSLKFAMLMPKAILYHFWDKALFQAHLGPNLIKLLMRGVK